MSDKATVEVVRAARPSKASRTLGPTVFRSNVELLTEYTGKLLKLAGKIRRANRSIKGGNQSPEASELRKERQTLVQLLNALRQPSKQLAQVTSQSIEHAGLAELYKVELKLRLAEFEQALQKAEISLHG